jgi:fatty acid CoA ligase FadD9
MATNKYVAYNHCTGCSKSLFDGDERHKCFECLNFYLCPKCNKKEKHPHKLVIEKRHQDSTEALIKKDAPSFMQIVRNAFEYWGARPCLGYRPRGTDGTLANEFTWLTYKDVFKRIKFFGFGLRKLAEPRDFVGVCAKNSVEWYVADFACYVNSFVGPVIPYNIDEEGLIHIMKSTKMKVMVCDDDVVEKALRASQQAPTMKFLVVMPNPSLLDKRIVMEKYKDLIGDRIKIYDWEEIEKMGKKNNSSMFVMTKPEDVLTLFYTSGSTGVPKGVVITESWARTWIARSFTLGGVGMTVSWANSDRKNDLKSLICGFRIAIYSGHVDLVFEDILLARPSSISASPVFWNKIYSEYKHALQSYIDGGDTPEGAEIKALKEFSLVLGDRINIIVTGGAATSDEVLKFLRKCFGNMASIYNSYGAREVGAIASDGILDKSLQYRLEDWEEYTSNDKPYPRGELVVKKADISGGYFGDKERTSEVFTEDGWYHTGDVVELNPALRSIKIIDRKKAIFKLAQGEYVAPSRLENIYMKSPFIEQIFIHGDMLQSYLLAIILPMKKTLLQWAERQFGKKMDDQWSDLVSHPDTQALIHSELIRIARTDRLRSHEVPFGLILTPNAFLNDNRKVIRHQIAKAFKQEISKTYADLGESPKNPLHDDSFKHKFKEILQSLGYSDNVVNDLEEVSLVNLGVDSLSAIKIRNLLKKDYAIDMPLNVLLGQDTSMNALSNMVELKSKDINSGFDIKNELKILDEIKVDPQREMKINTNKSKILLTGVTGFLGTQMLHELLTKKGNTIDSVYCLIRPSALREDKSGLAVIKKRFEFAELEWNSEYDHIIKPVLGDLSKENFGLEKEEFDSLCRSIDIIYHVAAYVNSVLPYASLKKANVIGTKQIVDFALNMKDKLLIYVSTTSVCWSYDFKKEIELIYEDQFDNAYFEAAGGYNSTKYVAERIVMSAIRSGLKAIVARPGMISSSTISGYAHLEDFDSRMLQGILQSKICPYNTQSKMEMNPVDFIARFICDLSEEYEQNLGKIFNLYNPHRVQFDYVVDKLEEHAKLKLERLAYIDWKTQILPKLDQSNPIYLLGEEYFKNRAAFPSRNSDYECTNSVNMMQKRGYNFPEINDAIIEKWIHFLLQQAAKSH